MEIVVARMKLEAAMARYSGALWEARQYKNRRLNYTSLLSMLEWQHPALEPGLVTRGRRELEKEQTRR